LPSGDVGQVGDNKGNTKTNVGPWKQDDNMERYNNRGNNSLPFSPTDREDNYAAAGNNRGNATATDDDGGNTNAGTLSPQPQQ
jgi:hypothetical protein